MNNNPINITESTLSAACHYLTTQFEAKSWWPRTQPGLAKKEFILMNGSAATLIIWCKRWFDARQCLKLNRAIQKLT